MMTRSLTSGSEKAYETESCKQLAIVCVHRGLIRGLFRLRNLKWVHNEFQVDAASPYRWIYRLFSVSRWRSDKTSSLFV